MMFAVTHTSLLPLDRRTHLAEMVISDHEVSKLLCEKQKLDIFRCVQNGNCLALRSLGSTAILGGIGWQYAVMPDTLKNTAIERMVYVRPDVRGTGAAEFLLKVFVDHVTEYGCEQIIAGSSLNSHGQARALYERLGFTTNYTFKKEL